MKTFALFKSFFIITVLILISSCSQSDNNYVDCETVKEDFLAYVTSNVDEITDVIVREYSREEGDDEITGQRVVDAFTAITFSSQWEEYETILKNNCPDTHQQFLEEAAEILLPSLILKFSSEINN